MTVNKTIIFIFILFINVSISVVAIAQTTDMIPIERMLAQKKLFRETELDSINLKLGAKDNNLSINIHIIAMESLLPADTPEPGNK